MSKLKGVVGMVTRKQLKQEARQELSGNWWTAIKVMIIPYLLLAVVLTIIGIATFISNPRNYQRIFILPSILHLQRY